MARTLPDGWEALAAAGAAPYEIATLRRLAAELPDDHAIFHGVHWTRLDHGYSVFGEVDFIVVGPQGQAVLIEQKNGPLEETPDGLVKHYTGKTKGVARQIHRSLASLQTRFQQGHAGQHLALDYLLYCPDYRVRSPATAGIPQSALSTSDRRIVLQVSGRAPSKLFKISRVLLPKRAVSPQLFWCPFNIPSWGLMDGIPFGEAQGLARNRNEFFTVRLLAVPETSTPWHTSADGDGKGTFQQRH